MAVTEYAVTAFLLPKQNGSHAMSGAHPFLNGDNSYIIDSGHWKEGIIL